MGEGELESTVARRAITQTDKLFTLRGKGVTSARGGAEGDLLRKVVVVTAFLFCSVMAQTKNIFDTRSIFYRYYVKDGCRFVCEGLSFNKK